MYRLSSMVCFNKREESRILQYSVEACGMLPLVTLNLQIKKNLKEKKTQAQNQEGKTITHFQRLHLVFLAILVYCYTLVSKNVINFSQNEAWASVTISVPFFMAIRSHLIREYEEIEGNDSRMLIWFEKECT